MSGLDPGLLAKAVAKLVTLNVRCTNLRHQQTVAILTSVSEGSKLTELDISCNDLSGLDPGLLARAVTKLETLEVIGTKLTQQQAVAILTTVSEGSKLTKLDISWDNLSGVDPGLLRRAVKRLKNIMITEGPIHVSSIPLLSGVDPGLLRRALQRLKNIIISERHKHVSSIPLL